MLKNTNIKKRKLLEGLSTPLGLFARASRPTSVREIPAHRRLAAEESAQQSKTVDDEYCGIQINSVYLYMKTLHTAQKSPQSQVSELKS